MFSTQQRSSDDLSAGQWSSLLTTMLTAADPASRQEAEEVLHARQEDIEGFLKSICGFIASNNGDETQSQLALLLVKNSVRSSWMDATQDTKDLVIDTLTNVVENNGYRTSTLAVRCLAAAVSAGWESPGFVGEEWIATGKPNLVIAGTQLLSAVVESGVEIEGVIGDEVNEGARFADVSPVRVGRVLEVVLNWDFDALDDDPHRRLSASSIELLMNCLLLKASAWFDMAVNLLPKGIDLFCTMDYLGNSASVMDEVLSGLGVVCEIDAQLVLPHIPKVLDFVVSVLPDQTYVVASVIEFMASVAEHAWAQVGDHICRLLPGALTAAILEQVDDAVIDFNDLDAEEMQEEGFEDPVAIFGKLLARLGAAGNGELQTAYVDSVAALLPEDGPPMSLEHAMSHSVTLGFMVFGAGTVSDAGLDLITSLLSPGYDSRFHPLLRQRVVSQLVSVAGSRVMLRHHARIVPAVLTAPSDHLTASVRDGGLATLRELYSFPNLPAETVSDHIEPLHGFLVECMNADEGDPRTPWRLFLLLVVIDGRAWIPYASDLSGLLSPRLTPAPAPAFYERCEKALKYVEQLRLEQSG